MIEIALPTLLMHAYLHLVDENIIQKENAVCWNFTQCL